VRAERRQALLKIGAQLFSERGYKDVSIADIARGAGVGTGTFYTYFAGKEDFYGEILDGIEERGREEVDRLVASFQSPLNRLKALYRFTTLGIRRNRLLLGVLTGDDKYAFPGLASRRERGDTLRTHIEETMGRILEDGARALELRLGVFRDPRRLTLALFDALLLQMDSEKLDELLNDALRLLERGLARRLRLRAGRERREQRRQGEAAPRHNPGGRR
jgi:AcrR family transcriptional regulator